jgi:chemotaxis signal transduction protein
VPFPTKRVRRVEAPASGRTRRFLLFEAAGFRCGLDVRILREVTEDPGIPPAEGGARPLLGSLPVQGGTLPTVDLAALFEGSGTAAATQVMRVRVDELLPAPPQIFGIRAECIRGVSKLGGRPVVWLATSRLLASAEPITMVE